VSTRVWLIGALSLALGAGAAIGALAFELEATNANSGYTLQDRQQGAPHEESGRMLHAVLNTQVQECKTMVLHGYDSVELAEYSGQFRAVTSNLGEMGLALRSSVAGPAARRVIEGFLHAKSEVRNNYEEAVRSFTDAVAGNAQETNQRVKANDLGATGQIEKAANPSSKRVNADVAAQTDVAAWRTLVASLAFLAAFGLTAAMVGFGVYKISDVLHRLAGICVNVWHAPRKPLPLPLLDIVPTGARLEYPDF
jgi:hypothetical protein